MDEQVQFQGEPQYAQPASVPTTSTITGLVIRLGLAKDPQSAGYILMGAAVVAILIALWLAFGGSSGSNPPLPPSPTGLPVTTRP